MKMKLVFVEENRFLIENFFKICRTKFAKTHKKRLVDSLLYVCILFRYQKCIWDLIEHPDTSGAAHIISLVSMMFVIVSTIGMSLNTMPATRVMC